MTLSQDPKEEGRDPHGYLKKGISDRGSSHVHTLTCSCMHVLRTAPVLRLPAWPAAHTQAQVS
jgi:hypothetical protein